MLNAEGRARAVIFGYACHPTTAALRMMYLVGTDYTGYARDWVAAAYPGAEAIFLQGCGGDIKPRAIRPSNEGATGLSMNWTTCGGQKRLSRIRAHRRQSQ